MGPLRTLLHRTLPAICTDPRPPTKVDTNRSNSGGLKYNGHRQEAKNEILACSVAEVAILALHSKNQTAVKKVAMSEYSKFVARGLVVCMVSLAAADFESPLEAAAAFTPTSVKEEIEQFGAGAKVRLKLAGGERLRGVIKAIEADDFVLDTGRPATSRRIAYARVAQVSLAKLTYRTSALPNAAEVRQVVIALGIGKHVMVRTSGGREYHGYTQAIEQHHFTVLPDDQGAPVQIAYSEVSHVERNMSTGPKIVLGVLLVIAVITITCAVASNHCGG